MKKKVRSFWQEFKTFIMRGSIIDLSVGIVVGGAFTSIVKSLTNDILMPFIGALLGGIDFSGLRFGLWNSKPIIDNGVQVLDEYGQPALTSAIYYGRFLQAVLDFLIIAFVVFILIKVINTLHRKVEELRKKEEAEKKEAEAETQKAQPEPADIVLLKEIRDLLKEGKE
ncbi:MAG TPA: large conductance mechanosensitive channel protein MscL [Bacilli bacterium]|jgi:large conductance mechanosensitive channel|nr:large conductance mechanosensitive channel protein MscL [Bacilli bacterium]